MTMTKYECWASEVETFSAGYRKTPIYLAADVDARIAELEAQYYQLILAVGHKFPAESRHQTALRYIRERELGFIGGPAQAIAPPKEAQQEGATLPPHCQHELVANSHAGYTAFPVCQKCGYKP